MSPIFPKFFQLNVVAYRSPTWDILRQTMVDMTPMYPMVVDFAVLGTWFVGLSLLTVWLWRWE